MSFEIRTFGKHVSFRLVSVDLLGGRLEAVENVVDVSVVDDQTLNNRLLIASGHLLQSLENIRVTRWVEGDVVHVCKRGDISVPACESRIAIIKSTQCNALTPCSRIKSLANRALDKNSVVCFQNN